MSRAPEHRPRAYAKPTLASGFKAVPPEGSSDAGTAGRGYVANGMEWRESFEARRPRTAAPRGDRRQGEGPSLQNRPGLSPDSLSYRIGLAGLYVGALAVASMVANAATSLIAGVGQ